MCLLEALLAHSCCRMLQALPERSVAAWRNSPQASLSMARPAAEHSHPARVLAAEWRRQASQELAMVAWRHQAPGRVALQVTMSVWRNPPPRAVSPMAWSAVEQSHLAQVPVGAWMHPVSQRLALRAWRRQASQGLAMVALQAVLPERSAEVWRNPPRASLRMACPAAARSYLESLRMAGWERRQKAAKLVSQVHSLPALPPGMG